MAASVTFIHSGDIHLGAPFRGLRALSPRWANRLCRAIPEAYDRMIDAAINRQVDFVLLAGDVFDTDKPSYAHYRHFLDGLQRLRDANIPVYAIAGNHDPYATWDGLRDTLPDNVFFFASNKPEYQVFSRAGEPVAIIAARGFQNLAEGGDMAAGITREAAYKACGVHASLVVGMLHTGLWMDPFKAPTSEDALYAANLDYWAMGHIHRNFCFPQNSNQVKAAYCGCIQGRDIKEVGDRGCWYVTVCEGDDNKLEFIPCESVEWEQLHVDVAACGGAEEILGACVRAMFDANSAATCEEMIARVTLCGASPAHDMLARPGVLEELRDELNERYPSFYCDALLDETSKVLDKQALRDAGMFSSVVLRQSDQQTENPEEVLAYIQKEFGERGISLPAGIERRLPELLKRAENMALDALEGGE